MDEAPNSDLITLYNSDFITHRQSRETVAFLAGDRKFQEEKVEAARFEAYREDLREFHEYRDRLIASGLEGR